MKKIAIITVNYNGKKDTLEFLESLSRLQRAPEGEGYRLQTIVVDNASSDGSVSEIKKQYPDVDILQAGKNLGFSGGFNKGIEYATVWGADYFLIVNNDCLIKDTNLVDELIETIKLDDKIGLVSPKIYFAKGFEFHKDRYKKEDLGKVIWYAGGKFDWDNIGSVHRGLDEVDSGQYDKEEQSEIFSGACVLIKKQVFEKVGLLDERFFLYFEDSDFAKRSLDQGFKIYYNGKSSIYHKVSQSTGIGSVLTDYYHTRNRLIFGLRYANFRTKLALLREALKLLVFGRSAQRIGVLDFLGLRSGLFSAIAPNIPPKSKEEVKYPYKLSIGIVNYNTADLTKKLIESIFKKDSGFDPYNMEVIVLDNGLIDPVKNSLKEYSNKIKYLENKENEGFSKGYNKTIKYSQGEYYLMFNSDIEVLKGGIKELVKWAEHYQGQAVLGGKLIFPDGSNQDSVFHLPTITGAYQEYFKAKKGSYFMFQPDGEKSPADSSSKPTKVEGMVMACLLIPRKILNKIGLLDERTFIFFEDIEYAKRLKQNNIPLHFVPTAKFIHHHGASTKRIGTQKAYEHLQKAAIFYHGKFYYFFLTWVLRLGQKLGKVKTPISRWTVD